MEPIRYTVQAAEDSLPLRVVLRRCMGISSTAMKAAKWSERILLNGAPRFVDAKVKAGDVVTFLPEEGTPMYIPSPCTRPVPVVYEDAWLLVVNKPAPLASQSSQKQPDDTLENMLYAYFGCPDNFVYRPVNRLDKGTSGLMVVAKTPHVQHLLQQ